MDHDEGMERRIDGIVEDDVRRGYRIKALPANLQQSLREALDGEPTMPQLTHVRFNKLTPKKKRLINEEVIRRYHLDLQNKALLSSARLRELNMERGEWSVEQEQRMRWLETETNQMMRDLYSEGFSARDQWARELVTITDSLRETFYALAETGEDATESAKLTNNQFADLMGAFERWLEYSPDSQESLNVRYGSLFHDGVYDVESDYGKMVQYCDDAEIIDLVNQADTLRDKLGRYIECITYREELLKLQIKQGKMLSESVEQRRDMTEEMARLYYSSEACDAAGVGSGRITKTFDVFWDLPEDVINWLLVEIFFFFEGTPDVEGARDFLSQWGFIAAPAQISASGAKESSDESPEVPSSNTDSPPAPETPADSSTSEIPTSLEISN